MKRAPGRFCFLAAFVLSLLLIPLLLIEPAYADETVARIDLTRHPVGYLALLIFFVAYGLVAIEKAIQLRKSKPVMLAAGLLRLGTVLRFVSNAVMVGFINAVGVNIVLGQLANLTGYAASGPNRVVRLIHARAWARRG